MSAALDAAQVDEVVGAIRERPRLACALRVWFDLTNSPARPRPAPADRGAAGRRRRGRGDRARLRPDGRAVRALRDRLRGHRPPSRRQARGQGHRVGRPLGGAGPLRPRAGASTSRSATAPTTSRSRPSRCGSRARRCSTTSGRRSSTPSTAGWATPSSCPTSIPPERLYQYGARGKVQPYAGLKEEYYLADFEPDAAVLDELDARSDPADGRRSHAAVGLALSPLRERPLRHRAAGAARAGPSCRPSARGRAARRAGACGRFHRARARDRRPVA